MRLRALLIAAALWLAAGPVAAQTIIDDSAYAPNQSRFTPIGGMLDDTGTDACTENNGCAARITAQRAWHVNLRNNSGSELGITASPLVVRIGDGTDLATVLNLAGEDPLAVAIVDGAGAQITSFGGGTQYAEDTAHVSGDTLTFAGVVQQSADAALSNDGDRSLLQVDSNGFLKVNIKAGAGSGGTASTDDAAFTAGSGSGTPMMGFVTTDDVDAGDVGVVAMTDDRAMHVNLRDGTGSELGTFSDPVHTFAYLRDFTGDPITDEANDALRVNVVAGSAGGPSKVDDAAFGVASDSVAPMGALADETSPDSVDEGDVGIPRMSLNRNLYAQIRDGSGERSVGVDATSLSLRVSLYQSGAGQVSTNNSVPSESDVGLVVRPLGPKLDNAAFVDGTTSIFPGGYIFDEVAGTALTENDVAAARIDAKRAQVAVIEDATTRGQRMAVDASGRLTIVCASGCSGGTEYTVNAVAPADPTGGTFVMERDDALSALTEVEGDWTQPRSNANGALWVAGDGTFNVGIVGGSVGLLAGTANIGDVDVLTLPSVTIGTFPDNEPFNVAQINGVTPLMGNGVTGTGSQRVTIASDNTAFTVNAAQATASNLNAEVQGDAATDAAVSGNPVYVGSRSSQDEPAAVSADGDATPFWVDRRGRLVVIEGHADSEPPVTLNVTASGNTTVISAPGASVSLCIKRGTINNRAATNRRVELQDGAGGTARFRAEVAAEGGMAPFDFGDRGWCLTANTLLNANLDAAGDVDVNVMEYSIE